MAIVELLGQMLKLPGNVLAWWLGGMTRLADGVRLVIAGGVDRVFAPPAAGDGNDRKTSSAGDAGAGTTLKEIEMSDDNCGVTDCTIRLFQYTIVSIKRGREGVLERGEKLVSDPMDECDFDTWVIADYVRRNPNVPPGEERYLRVASELLDTWQKQALHFEERQLGILQEISDKLG